MAQIYSHKLWNHVNYHTNGANLQPHAMESRKLPYKWRKSKAKRYGIMLITNNTNGANLQPEAMESRKLPYQWRSKAMESRKLPYK